MESKKRKENSDSFSVQWLSANTSTSLKARQHSSYVFLCDVNMHSFKLLLRWVGEWIIMVFRTRRAQQIKMDAVIQWCSYSAISERKMADCRNGILKLMISTVGVAVTLTNPVLQLQGWKDTVCFQNGYEMYVSAWTSICLLSCSVIKKQNTIFHSVSLAWYSD